MRMISISGVDGTGKTTLLGSLQMFPTLRSPQYFESVPGFRYAQVSRELEDLGRYADQTGDVKTKAVALFLAMTLAGDAESEALSSDLGQKTHTLVRERDPIVDSIVYSGFYLKILASGWNHAAIPTEFLASVQNRCEYLGCRLDQLGTYICELFSKTPTDLASSLYQIYRCRPTQQFVILYGNEATIRERIRLKKKENSGASEAHEDVETLMKLQAGMRQVTAMLALAQDSQVVEILIDGRSIESIRSEVQSIL